MVSAQGGSADEAEAHLFSMQSGGVFFCVKVAISGHWVRKWQCALRMRSCELSIFCLQKQNTPAPDPRAECALGSVRGGK